MKTTEQRFWDKVNKTDTCWVWTASVSGNGYGCFKWGDKQGRAHRYSAELHGMDITDKIVCHKCDNRLCIRPDHLFVGTQQDNIDDMMSKDRWDGGGKYLRKLTDDQVREIRSSNQTAYRLGKIYGVNKGIIRFIKNGTTYQDVI